MRYLFYIWDKSNSGLELTDAERRKTTRWANQLGGDTNLARDVRERGVDSVKKEMEEKMNSALKEAEERESDIKDSARKMRNSLSRAGDASIKLNLLEKLKQASRPDDGGEE